MNSKLARMIALAVPAIALCAFSVAQGRREPPRAKNLKVLQNLPHDRLIPVMQSWNQALGVRCEFCHVERQFDLDTKPEKNVAREMVRLTESINKNRAVHGKVTCFTCHRGQKEPEGRAEGRREGWPGGRERERDRDRDRDH